VTGVGSATGWEPAPPGLEFVGYLVDLDDVTEPSAGVRGP